MIETSSADRGEQLKAMSSAQDDQVRRMSSAQDDQLNAETAEQAETLLSRLLSLNEETHITREKFLDLSSSLDIASEELDIIFNALDLNGDGVISMEELRHSFADTRLKEREEEEALVLQYNTIQLYRLYVEKFAFCLVIYIKTFNTVNNKTSTTQ